MIVVVCSVLCLVLTILLYVVAVFSRSAKKSRDANNKRKLAVLFIDGPDPDNPASAAAIVKHVLGTQATPHHLHIVLTGRPVNLRTSKASGGVLLLETIPRQPWETNEPVHAEKVLEDSAARIQHYLTRCNIDITMVTIYNGGVAHCAPISDRVHDWDFLFDRKDLVTGQEVDRGSILRPHEYKALVDEISAFSEDERERRLLSILRPHPLTPLAALITELETSEEVVIFLGGPATALVQLFGGSRESKHTQKVVELYGMFGSLHPGKNTLLPNQFNVACDIEAACTLFVDNLFPYAEKYLIPTEIAKSKCLVLASRDFQDCNVGNYFVDLQNLWEFTHRGTAQPMFDVLPIMASMRRFRGCFKWSRKKAVLKEWQPTKATRMQQTFCFADSDDHKHPMVAIQHTHKLNKDVFLEFLCATWDSAHGPT